MIKAILLIFWPAGTWETIAMAKKSVAQVLFLFLIPTIFISVGVELAGMAHWGRYRNFGSTVNVPQDSLLQYGAVQLALDFALAFVAAWMVKSFTGTFQKRYTFASAFALVSYGLGPLLLFHLIDAYPFLNPWITFSIGMLLSVAAIYSGVPRMLQPDPPHAFGVFLTSAIMLTGMMALARLTSLLLLIGRLNEYTPGG